MNLAPFAFDHSVTSWVVSLRAEPWNSLWQMITVLGDTLTLVLLALGIFMVAWLLDRIDLAALIVVGAGVGWLVMALLKRLFGRDRPPIADRLIDVGGLSFPSGHAMMSTVVIGLAAVIVYQLYPQVRATPGLLALAPALIVLIGLSRVYLGVHWMSDVLVGWVLGVVWLALCLVGHQQIARWVRQRTEPEITVVVKN
ncbi:MAG: phosphatase PAP2 family protein [Gordonia sp. (in: high G+C Gram-positive bacteria)]|uniref:phosphatase PAP2 family protein n=1 Tax=Gordonia sp. (in: high G+C Gram-positive bacteria) TaxID=84139 RepID=UPI003BB7074D